MTKRERALHGTMSWVDLQTPDLDRARAFCGPLLGWTFVGGDATDMGFYTTAMIDGLKVGKHKGAELLDDDGAMAWHETYSRDVVRARAFYADVFGLTAKRARRQGRRAAVRHAVRAHVGRG